MKLPTTCVLAAALLLVSGCGDDDRAGSSDPDAATTAASSTDSDSASSTKPAITFDGFLQCAGSNAVELDADAIAAQDTYTELARLAGTGRRIAGPADDDWFYVIEASSAANATAVDDRLVQSVVEQSQGHVFPEESVHGTSGRVAWFMFSDLKEAPDLVDDEAVTQGRAILACLPKS
ncbi:MAG: hypothetical protein KDC46_04435 [Thermoleophilia bacterium]|nr:hypothetical protein [Thermoleophilia bacterium]